MSDQEGLCNMVHYYEGRIRSTRISASRSWGHWSCISRKDNL